MARSPLGPPITTDPPREPQPLRCKPYALAFGVVGATAVLVVSALGIAAAIVGDSMDDAERLRDMGNAILWAHEDGATLAEAFEQARTEGFGASISGYPVRFNPDEGAWRRGRALFRDGSAPPLLVLNQFIDIYGETGYFVYTGRNSYRLMPKHEFPQWARP